MIVHRYDTINSTKIFFMPSVRQIYGNRIRFVFFMPIFHFLGATSFVSRDRSRVQEIKPVNSNYSYSVSILDNNCSSLMTSIDTSTAQQSMRTQLQCNKLRLRSTVFISLNMSSRKGARTRCGGTNTFARHVVQCWLRIIDFVFAAMWRSFCCSADHRSVAE